MSVENCAECPEKIGIIPLSHRQREPVPMRFGQNMSEPCSPQEPAAIALEILDRTSKQALEKTLAKMPDKLLREAFRLEANTHKAIMQRVGAGKAKCVKRWRGLRPFLVDILWELGRRPSATHTLDRKNNAVRRYGPGLCRWALPEVQNNNRSCSLNVKHPVTGEVFTAVKLAELLGYSERHARRLITTKTASEIFDIEVQPAPPIAAEPARRRGWYDNCGDWHDRDEEDAYWRDFDEHFGPPPVPRLRSLPLTEEQLGSRGPDEEWLLIDEELRQEQCELSRRRCEERQLLEAKAALARVHSGEEPWLDYDHWLVLRGAKINMRKDADWEQFVSDNPLRF
jgi:hypothetical protein